MRVIISAVFCAVFSLAAFAADQPKDYALQKVPTDFKTHSDDQKRFAIQYPPAWKVTTSDEDATLAAGKADAPETCNVRWVKVGDAPLKAIVDETLKSLPKSIKGFKLDKSEAVKFGDLDAHLLIMSGEFSDQTVTLGEILIAKAPMLYILTFGTTPARWEEQWQVGQQIIASFKPGEAK